MKEDVKEELSSVLIPHCHLSWPPTHHLTSCDCATANRCAPLSLAALQLHPALPNQSPPLSLLHYPCHCHVRVRQCPLRPATTQLHSLCHVTLETLLVHQLSWTLIWSRVQTWLVVRRCTDPNRTCRIGMPGPERMWNAFLIIAALTLRSWRQWVPRTLHGPTRTLSAWTFDQLLWSPPIVTSHGDLPMTEYQKRMRGRKRRRPVSASPMASQLWSEMQGLLNGCIALNKQEKHKRFPMFRLGEPFMWTVDNLSYGSKLVRSFLAGFKDWRRKLF